MFIYCFAASELTSKVGINLKKQGKTRHNMCIKLQVVSIYDDVYCINWYTYPVKFQPLVGALIQQLQIPQYLRGLGFFDCSLETFVKVTLNYLLANYIYTLIYLRVFQLLKFIGSMTAVLQSMK